MSIILALIIFSVLVLFHEFGHFLLAKLNHIEVLEFSLGMGPRLVSFERGGTRYCIKIFPFGGSCMMKGEDGEDVSPGSFNSAPVWGRILVVAAGPVFNFIMAFFVALILVGISGYDAPTVLSVDEGSSVEAAGLQEGDRITSFNGYKVHVGRDLYMYLNLIGAPDDSIEIQYVRDGEKQSLTYVPDSQEKYMLGFSYYPGEEEAEVASLTIGGAMSKAGLQAGDIILEVNGTVINTGAELEAYMDNNPLDGSAIHLVYLRGSRLHEADITPSSTTIVAVGFTYNLYNEKASALNIVRYGFEEVRYWIRTTILSLRMLVTGKVTVNDMSGPVGIVTTIGDTYEQSKSYGVTAIIASMLEMVILLSANLGVMNLLPIPALDGGRLVFLVIEAIRRKPVNRDIEGRIHFAGFALLMLLIVYISVHDLVKLF